MAKRLLHILPRAALILSTLLCLTATAIHLRGKFYSDSLGWAGWQDQNAGQWHGWGIQSKDGHLTAYHFFGKALVYDPSSIGDVQMHPDAKPRYFHVVARATAQSWTRPFRVETIDSKWSIRFKLKLIAAPTWFLIVIFAMAPGLVLISQLLRRLRRKIPYGFEVLQMPTSSNL